jgi:hypothetical protein
MLLSVRFIRSLAAATALTVCAGTFLQAQDSSTQTSNSAQTTLNNGSYIAIDPLANVRYDNRYDLSLGMAYAHIKAGPTLLQGANLGGLDLSGSYWLTRHWGVEGSGRATVGTSGAAVNDENSKGGPIEGPFVAQYMFLAGPEWLGPHNKHGALIAHVLVGGAYGEFQKDLLGNPPADFDFYNNQVAPAAAFGGHFDLNRSPQWVFRVSPDALWTRYSTNYATTTSPAGGRNNWNFGISVGLEYRFKKKR